MYLCFQSDVLDVNEIFRDLGAMISEQGEMLSKCLASEKVEDVLH